MTQRERGIVRVLQPVWSAARTWSVCGLVGGCSTVAKRRSQLLRVGSLPVSSTIRRHYSRRVTERPQA